MTFPTGKIQYSTKSPSIPNEFLYSQVGNYMEIATKFLEPFSIDSNEDHAIDVFLGNFPQKMFMLTNSLQLGRIL